MQNGTSTRGLRPLLVCGGLRPLFACGKSEGVLFSGEKENQRMMAVKSI